MQISRLFEIIYILLHRKIITAKELAEHFEVSTRTIYRDIEVLSSAGIPVYANQGKLYRNYVMSQQQIKRQSIGRTILKTIRNRKMC